MGRSRQKRTDPNSDEEEGTLAHTLKKMRKSKMMVFLKEHDLLKPCSVVCPTDPPTTGEMVWARNYGSVYWPAFIAFVKDREDFVEAEPSSQAAAMIPIDETTYTFVMFLEKSFRIAPITWDNIIPFRSVQDQELLVPRFNKLVVKKSWKPTIYYKEALELIKEFLIVPPGDRQELAITKYKETGYYCRRATKEAKSEAPDAAKKDTADKLVSRFEESQPAHQTQRSSSLRVSTRILQKEILKEQGESQKTSTATEKTESTPVEKKRNSELQKNTRPSVGGEMLKSWTKDMFDSLEKQFVFDTNPLRCHACKNTIESSDDVKMCHALPHHTQCLLPCDDDSESRKCKICIERRCFICKEVGQTPPMKCTRCDLRFHISCLEAWPQAEIQGSNGPITCPLHFCHTCLGEHRHNIRVRDYTAPQSKSFRCFDCLSAYHKVCLPAGCGEEIMGKDLVICPKHKLPDLPVKQRRIGCLNCFKPVKPKDVKMYCVFCTQVVHPECVGYTDKHKAKGVTVEAFGLDYKCSYCTWGLFPVYGQVVWFQQSRSQYWPARILYPGELKYRQKIAKRKPGEFSIEYFGCTSTPYYDNASRVLPLHLTTVEIFKAMKVYQDIPKHQRTHEEAAFFLMFSEKLRDSLLPPARPIYKKIDKNVYRSVHVGKVKEPSDVCSCADSDKTSSQVCTADGGCTNRDSEMECSDRTCKAGIRCSNRMFRERKNDEEFVKLELVPNKGWGVVARKGFKADDFVAEYRGEVIDKEEKTWRLGRKQDEDPLYIMELDKGYFIDAEYVGNLSRFINHSCDPNCAVRKYLSLGKPVRGVYAIKDIKEGEELTFNYAYRESTAAFRCRCGSNKCAIFIGKNVPEGYNVGEDVDNETATDNWDDECFVCKSGGMVFCCDFPHCRKVCHYYCIPLQRAPKGSWFCSDHPENEIAKLKSSSASQKSKRSRSKTSNLKATKSLAKSKNTPKSKDTPGRDPEPKKKPQRSSAVHESSGLTETPKSVQSSAKSTPVVPKSQKSLPAGTAQEVKLPRTRMRASKSNLESVLLAEPSAKLEEVGPIETTQRRLRSGRKESEPNSIVKVKRTRKRVQPADDPPALSELKPEPPTKLTASKRQKRHSAIVESESVSEVQQALIRAPRTTRRSTIAAIVAREEVSPCPTVTIASGDAGVENKRHYRGRKRGVSKEEVSGSLIPPASMTSADSDSEAVVAKYNYEWPAATRNSTKQRKRTKIVAEDKMTEVVPFSSSPDFYRVQQFSVPLPARQADQLNRNKAQKTRAAGAGSSNKIPLPAILDPYDMSTQHDEYGDLNFGDDALSYLSQRIPMPDHSVVSSVNYSSADEDSDLEVIFKKPAQPTL